ncbi:hypothetical protein BC830DRAFT_1141635 [Chytriomyces sp. MP71]|nr:hypothetical protein BC830DRAFT_1141635 [Chytriomyces sp. MP71]
MASTSDMTMTTPAISSVASILKPIKTWNATIASPTESLDALTTYVELQPFCLPVCLNGGDPTTTATVVYETTIATLCNAIALNRFAALFYSCLEAKCGDATEKARMAVEDWQEELMRVCLTAFTEDGIESDASGASIFHYATVVGSTMSGNVPSKHTCERPRPHAILVLIGSKTLQERKGI